MTVFGGEKTTWGTRVDGFFLTCCKCGWHSKVQILILENSALVTCNKCGNEVGVPD